MSTQREFKLNTGASIPALGLGTWQSAPKDVYDAVLTAIRAGYRHIDTAFIYGNETEVGKAIKDSGVPREEIFLTTKLWNNSHRPEHVKEALETSLSNLQTGYIDLWLMHWPVAFRHGKELVPRDEHGQIVVDDVDYTETYGAMEKLLGDKVRAIGVSNFNVKKLERLLKTATVAPAVNQVELHPYLPQEDLVRFCQKHGIVVTAYSPLGSTNSPLFKDKTITALAEKYKVSPAQILISWGIHRKYVVIPKSVTPSRIQSNFEDVELEEDDFQKINDILKTQPTKRLVEPKNFWGIDVFEE
ncbi:NADP-dependent oxidoreductase domain-containing protein [Pilobolus umbonatus]|nr:NADP-dependent oxidoreductase domain-containing protein [Pilobolus umbonatus]